MASGSRRLCEFGDFRLDRERRLLLGRDGVSIPLPSKAFDTLSYLVEHAGRVVDKNELMRTIWPNTAVEENNLNQNISLLRRLLGEVRGEHRYIATVPSRGFQFVAKVRLSNEPLTHEPTGTVSIAVRPFVNVS